MRTAVFTDRELPRVLPSWRRLESEAISQPVASAMLSGPLRADGAFIAALYDQERLVGLWPLRVGRQGALRIATRLGRELQPYDGIVLAPGVSPAEAAQRLWEAVQKRCPADVLRLRAIRDDCPLRTISAVRQGAAALVETHWLETGALSAPEDVLTRLSKSRRKSARRNRRKLERLGEVRFSRLREAGARAAAIRAALALKKAWLTEQDLHSFALGASWFDDGLIAAASSPALVGHVEVFTLSVSGEAVAYELGFRDRSGYASFLGAFSPEWGQLGVGAELTACVLRWCVQQRVPRCDLLPPASSFKAGWCSHSAPVWSAQLPLSRRGRLLRPLSGAARQLKPLYLRLPAQVRRPLNSLLQQLR